MPNIYYENQTTIQEPTTPQRTEADSPQTTPPPENQTTPQSTPDITDNITDDNTINENTQNELNENTFPDNSTGRLRVSAFTANQLSPVANATVTVSTQDGENSTVVDTSVTDRSGSSVTFTLPAPNASFSQEPTTASPFALYRVSVSHPDFFEFIAENVQIFGGIVTQLPVNLIPLPELSNGETTKIVIIPNQNL